MGLMGGHFLGLVRVFAAFWVVFPLSVGQASAQSVADQATRLLRSLDTLSARANMTDKGRAKAFLGIAENAFNIDHIAAASLPRTLKLSSAAQQAYAKAFRVHLSLAYVEGQRSYGATVSEVVGVRQRHGKPPIVFLKARSGGTIRRSSWGLCSTEIFRICEIEVEGVRLAARHRSDFSAVIRRDGFPAFLKALRSGALVHL
jgi:ABC-type transporter MlaC component